ncbi:GDSL esterase/lipase At1g28600 [Linum perenne]
MAHSTTPLLYFFFLLLPFLALGSPSSSSQCYTSLFSFGDSATATGVQTADLAPGKLAPHCAFLPYGTTFFHKPTGRCSDGRLIVDFLSNHFGLPLLQAYHGNKLSAGNGANLAVVSATALSPQFLKTRGISGCLNCSLDVQIKRFKILLKSLQSTPSKRKDYLKKSLILLGEIGGVDYQRASVENSTAHAKAEVESLIPIVVKRIGSAIEDLIRFGAVNFLVPGDFPKGCFPSYLTTFQSKNKADYDSRTGCLIYHNRFSYLHNQMLRKEIKRVGKLHPKVSIQYADYYGSAMRLHLNPKKYGFVKATMNRACCGAGGPYNYNRTAVCGRAGAVACGNPNSYIKWDDHHYTDSANTVIARDVFKAGFPRYSVAACK